MVSALILGVDERHVCEPNKSENVTKVGLLEIECFSGSALLVGASASGDDDDLFHLQKPARAIGSGAEGFSDPHNLVNPSLQWDEMEKLYMGAPMTIVSAARSSSISWSDVERYDR